ncbi:hypothetical protein ACN2XU_22975 [Primorskyibacter sp. 2E107]|uniref:hypothetical protein n=1 Tax=Primorskyibacter sp. 2E107 TaxID=3403458 RepID=UPI003AF8C535
MSAEPVTAERFAVAEAAAATCGAMAPNWAGLEVQLKAAGYVETDDAALKAAGRREGAVILEDPTSGALVLIGSRGGEGTCIVGMEGLTPQQSYGLALPWVKSFDLQTIVERGQGLAKNAVQAWGRLEPDRDVYVAAYKTWDVLDGPGAAARLQMSIR